MYQTRLLASIAGLCCAALAACGGGGTSATATAPVVPPAVVVVPVPVIEVSVPVSDARQIEIEDKIVSAFENSTTVIQYAFIANINDGRGYTAGRSGFTSGTGDLLIVVEEYTKLVPGNVLSVFASALLRVRGTSSVVGLNGLVAAWKTAATDPKFIAVQDAVNNALYRDPSRALATAAGATLPLSKLAIYEASIQHGVGTYPDSLNSILDRASAAAGGTPKSGVDEKKWLLAVLTERRRTLLNPIDPVVGMGWAATVSRADAIMSIYNAGNFNLDKAITITVYGDTFSI